jgi:hypothetical protein
MRTARTLEARQVLWASVVTGAKKDESNSGRVWAAGFQHVTNRARWAHVSETYEPFIYLIFQLFFGPR